MDLKLSERSDLTHLLLIAAIIVPLFVINARWGVEGNPDAIAAGAPAWQVVRNGTLDMSDYSVIADNLEPLNRWFVEVDSGAIVSNRAPGLIAIAVPAYLLFGGGGYSNGPATVVALISTTLAVLVVWHVLKPLVGRSLASWSALVLALGTTTWWVSSSELWPHGPGQLWAALALAGLSSDSYLRTGAFFGLSIVTRPLTALFAAVTGLAEGWRLRSLDPVWRIGVTASIGLVVVLVYNRLVFGDWNIRDGYSEAFTTGAMDRFTVASYLRNVIEMFIGPRNGVLVTSPIIGVGTVGAALIWRQIPGWAKSATLAAVVYLLVHAALNRASGGSVVFYRYPLEGIVLAMPVLTLGARALWMRSRAGRILVMASAGVSVVLQVLHVFYFSCFITDPVVATCLVA